MAIAALETMLNPVIDTRGHCIDNAAGSSLVAHHGESHHDHH
ncbi:hypothetical protein C8D96_0829 [Kushneria marisflavi]|nr:hypothetical protein C8D96_0829 [Kushneria marisflavi]